MQCAVKFYFRHFGFLYVITIRFVNHHCICHFHNTTFDTLQFITGTGNFEQQKKIHHTVYSRFALSNPNCFNDNFIEIPPEKF